MDENKTYNFYEDPGHGWIKVSSDDLSYLGIMKKISGCSYCKGFDAYLEEDCDASTFFMAFEKKFGFEPKIKRIYQDHTPIRDYASYPQSNEYDWASNMREQSAFYKAKREGK